VNRGKKKEREKKNNENEKIEMIEGKEEKDR